MVINNDNFSIFEKIYYMKYIFLFFALISATLSFGQSTSDLDARNGIKDFTIGDDISKWKQYLTVADESGDNRNYYYNGPCCKSIFGYTIEGIMLGFKNAKLENVIIGIPLQKPYSETGQYTSWRSSDFEKINSELTFAFGEPSGMGTKDGSGGVTYSWGGKKVKLFSIYMYDGVKNGDRHIIMVSKKETKSDSVNDF